MSIWAKMKQGGLRQGGAWCLSDPVMARAERAGASGGRYLGQEEDRACSMSHAWDMGPAFGNQGVAAAG